MSAAEGCCTPYIEVTVQDSSGDDDAWMNSDDERNSDNVPQSEDDEDALQAEGEAVYGDSNTDSDDGRSPEAFAAFQPLPSVPPAVQNPETPEKVSPLVSLCSRRIPIPILSAVAALSPRSGLCPHCAASSSIQYLIYIGPIPLVALVRSMDKNRVGI